MGKDSTKRGRVKAHPKLMKTERKESDINKLGGGVRKFGGKSNITTGRKGNHVDPSFDLAPFKNKPSILRQHVV